MLPLTCPATRLVTGLNQSVVQNLDYLPLGEITSSDSGTTHKFTGWSGTRKRGWIILGSGSILRSWGGGVRRTLPAYRTGRRG